MTDEKRTCACAPDILDPELMKQFDEVLEEYCDKPGGLIPALQIGQTMFGFLPKQIINRVSLKFNKSYSEVAGIVGFYSFFSTTPRGKNMIRVCLGTACYVRGGKQILDAIKRELSIDVGQTTDDRMFSLEVARCFGACGLAPVITVNDDIHQRVKVTKIREILDRYRVQSADGKENK